MLNPIITPPRVPLVDPATGLISRAWYLFFLSLNNVSNDVVDNPALGPSAESLIASYDALLQTLAQEVQTQPSQESALDQIAELQKQIASLELQPRNELGTLAEQDANAVAIIGGTINNTAIGGTTPAAGTFTTLTATGQTSLGGVAGAESFRAVPVASSAQYIAAYGSTGQTPYLVAEGANANINLALSSKGASGGASNIRFFTNNMAQEQMRVVHTASAVNYVQVTGAATGNRPTISVQGSDTNVVLDIQTKGTGHINFTPNRTNYVSLYGAGTGGFPQFIVAGTDTNIDLALTPKGTGNVRFGTYTGTVLTPTGYVEIKDSSGTIRRLLVG
jgi:hypothetical protein